MAKVCQIRMALLSTAVYRALDDLRRELQERSSEQKEEVQDPSPDDEVRLDFSSIMGEYIHCYKNETRFSSELH